MDIHRTATEFADRIEAELRRIGVWRDAPPPAAAFESGRAFFADTMSLFQWLQWVLLARVRMTVAGRGRFPSQSQVGAYAIRALDGMTEADALVSLLCEFDAAIEAAARRQPHHRRTRSVPRDGDGEAIGPPPDAAADALPMAEVIAEPAPAPPPLSPRDVVQRWWRSRELALLHPAPRSRAGFDTTLVDRVFDTAEVLHEVLDEGTANADGIGLRTHLSGWRGEWVALTVLRRDGEHWRVDLPLSVTHTALWLLRLRRDGGPQAQDDDARGVALRYWSRVQNGQADAARDLQLDPALEPPRLATGIDEYVWLLNTREQPGGADVGVLMNAHDGCRVWHTPMVRLDAGWRVDRARLLDEQGRPP